MKHPLASLCLALALAGATFGTTPSHAAIVLVPDDYPTLQQALDAADTVHVRGGVYDEAITLMGEGRTRLLRSYPSSSRVVVRGLTFEGQTPGTFWKVQGLELEQTVDLRTRNVEQRVTFEHCVFRAGVAHTAWYSDYDRPPFADPLLGRGQRRRAGWRPDRQRLLRE